MSKFHFSADLAENIRSTLETLNARIQNDINTLSEIVESLRANDGFGIGGIIENVLGEISSDKHIGLSAESGVTSIKSILESTNNSSNMSVAIMNAALRPGIDAINSVIKDSQSSPPTESTQPSTPSAPKWPDGVVTNEYTYSKDGMIYTPVTYAGNTVLLRTDSAGGIGIFRMDESLFPTYNQYTQHFTHGENPGVECTSTALAQSSTINGIPKVANDYNDGNGITQIAGYRCSSEDITRFCVDRLKMGQTTVIYYNYAGYEGTGINNGHAVVVVGANANATSVYDLNVIDPATGAYVNFGAACGQKSSSMYICYESNPWSYGGECTKPWDIGSYFGVNL